MGQESGHGSAGCFASGSFTRPFLSQLALTPYLKTPLGKIHSQAYLHNGWHHSFPSLLWPLGLTSLPRGSLPRAAYNTAACFIRASKGESRLARQTLQ